MSKRPLLSLVALAFLTACGPAEPDPKVAEAEKAAADKKKADEDALAKRKADREAKAQAAKDAEEAEKAAIDALAVLPETLPKKLDKACDARAQAEDDFMLKHYEGEARDKWNGAKATQLATAKQMCMAGKIEVAACQINALNSAPTELRKKLPDLLKACMDKFGGDAGGA